VYVTGWLSTQPANRSLSNHVLSVQTLVDQRNPSAFAAKQLLIAHCASAIRSAQACGTTRESRAGFGLAEPSQAIPTCGSSGGRCVTQRHPCPAGAENGSYLVTSMQTSSRCN